MPSNGWIFSLQRCDYLSEILNRKRLVIVGCGASAVLALAALANYQRDPSIVSTRHSAAIRLGITILDDNPARPRGLAYSAIHPSLVLNVPAVRMGAFSDDPAHFYRWLQHTSEWKSLHPAFAELSVSADDFIPRAIYGEYLIDVFDHAVQSLRAAGHTVELQSERVSAVKQGTSASAIQVITASGLCYEADTVLMATGNYPSLLCSQQLPAILPSPYVDEALHLNWKKINHLLIVGSGLSLVDAVQLAMSQGFAGTFHVVSRHGLLPHAHGASHHPDVPVFNTEAKKASAILHEIRQYIERNEKSGIAWQCSVNQLREQNNALWSALTPSVRNRLKKALPWWNSVRHRIPASTKAMLDNLQVQGRLCIHRATVNAIQITHNGFILSLAALRSKNITLEIIADKAIMCTGYGSGFLVVQDACAHLLDNANALTATVIGNKHYRISSGHEIYGIRPALGGVLFETTAIHEIREQAVCIAKAIFTTTTGNTNSAQAVGVARSMIISDPV